MSDCQSCEPCPTCDAPGPLSEPPREKAHLWMRDSKGWFQVTSRNFAAFNLVVDRMLATDEA